MCLRHPPFPFRSITTRAFFSGGAGVWRYYLSNADIKKMKLTFAFLNGALRWLKKSRRPWNGYRQELGEADDIGEDVGSAESTPGLSIGRRRDMESRI